MSTDTLGTAAGVAGRRGEAGPMLARVLEALDDAGCGPCIASVAERSPVGPRAVRLQPARDGAAPAESGCPEAACAPLARWLERQPWVEAVAVRPPGVYARVRTVALRAWVAECLTPCGGGPWRAGSRAPLQAPRDVPLDAGVDTTLDEFRRAAVDASIAALVALGPDVPAASPGAMPVGRVDVPHGPLRARYGGAVSTADVLHDVGRRARGSAAFDTAAIAAGAASVLAFALLRTPREEHIRLDDARLQVDVDAFLGIASARRLAGERAARPTGRGAHASAVGTGERWVRALALDLDALPRVTAQAVEEREPSLVARYARALAERTNAAAPHLSAGDPLWPTVDAAIAAALASLAIDSPPIHPPAALDARAAAY